MKQSVRRALRCAPWALAAASLGPLYALVPPSPDLALFDYIAWLSTKGAHFYSGAAEQNWPGSIFLHEMAMRVFGPHAWTYRAFDFLLLQIACFGGWLFLKRAGFRVAPWLFPPLYILLYATGDVWFSGQRDVVAGGFMLLAAALILPFAEGRAAHEKRGALQVAIAGALMGYCVLIRPTFLAYALGALIVIWQPLVQPLAAARGLRLTGLIAGGFSLVVATALLMGVASGNLDDWWTQTIAFNLEAYPTPTPPAALARTLFDFFVRYWHWITALALVGGALWIARDRVTRAQMLLAGIAATSIASFIVQAKGFGYHLGGVLPTLTVFVAIAFDELLRRARSKGLMRRAALGGLVLASLLAGAGAGKKALVLAPEARRLVSGDGERLYRDKPHGEDIGAAIEFVKRETRPDDPILQWGRNFEIGTLAGRRPSIRYVSTPALYLLRPEQAFYEDWRREILGALAKAPPAVVIFDNAEIVIDGGAVRLADGAPPFVAEMFQTLAPHYVVAFRSPSLTIWRRRADENAP